MDVNKILSHPTMPVTITGGEDRKLRYFDNRTGLGLLFVYWTIYVEEMSFVGFR